MPSNLILNQGKIAPNYFLGGMTCLLGILGMCQGLTQSYGGLLALRFLMGALEASLPAGAAYMISIYYTKKEAAVRFAAFFNFALLGPFFSGLLAYAIENLDGTGGYEGWRWVSNDRDTTIRPAGSHIADLHHRRPHDGLLRSRRFGLHTKLS